MRITEILITELSKTILNIIFIFVEKLQKQVVKKLNSPFHLNQTFFIF